MGPGRRPRTGLPGRSRRAACSRGPARGAGCHPHGGQPGRPRPSWSRLRPRPRIGMLTRRPPSQQSARRAELAARYGKLLHLMLLTLPQRRPTAGSLDPACPLASRCSLTPVPPVPHAGRGDRAGSTPGTRRTPTTALGKFVVHTASALGGTAKTPTTRRPAKVVAPRGGEHRRRHGARLVPVTAVSTPPLPAPVASQEQPPGKREVPSRPQGGITASPCRRRWLRRSNRPDYRGEPPRPRKRFSPPRRRR